MDSNQKTRKQIKNNSKECVKEYIVDQKERQDIEQNNKKIDWDGSQT